MYDTSSRYPRYGMMPTMTVEIPRPSIGNELVAPFMDIVQLHDHPEKEGSSGTIGSIGMMDGVLELHRFGCEDRRLLHEVGHLLCRPIDFWYRAEMCVIDFRFRRPTSLDGIRRMSKSEAQAIDIQNILASRYGMERDIRSLPLLVAAYVHEHCHPLTSFTSPSFFVDACNVEPISFVQIMNRWEALVGELRRRRSSPAGRPEPE